MIENEQLVIKESSTAFPACFLPVAARRARAPWWGGKGGVKEPARDLRTGRCCTERLGSLAAGTATARAALRVAAELRRRREGPAGSAAPRPAQDGGRWPHLRAPSSRAAGGAGRAGAVRSPRSGRPSPAALPPGVPCAVTLRAARGRSARMRRERRRVLRSRGCRGCGRHVGPLGARRDPQPRQG